jgi:hypothetical protein
MHRNAHGTNKKPSPGSSNAVIATAPSLTVIPRPITRTLDVKSAVHVPKMEGVTISFRKTIQPANAIT